MANGYAQAIVIGNLTNNIELTTTKSGKIVGKFTVAVNDYRGAVHFFDCEAWEQKAEVLEKYAKKGSELTIIGILEQQKWEKDGSKRSKVVISVRDFRFGKSAKDDTPVEEHEVLEQVDVDKPIDLSEIPFN